MCLIIIKEVGKELVSKKMISEVWEKNPHGAGLIYKKKNGSSYKMIKGLMTEEDLISTVKSLNLTKDDWIAYHLRWATSGDIDQKTTHPFVVHNDKDVINTLSVERSDKTVMVMHNGVIYDLNDKTAKESDTQRLISEYLSKIAYKELLYNDAVKSLIEKFIDGSRLLIVHGREGHVTYGKWHEHEGYMISKPYKDATVQKFKKTNRNNQRFLGFQSSSLSRTTTQFDYLFDIEDENEDPNQLDIFPTSSVEDSMKLSEDFCNYCGMFRALVHVPAYNSEVCSQCINDYQL